MTPERSSSGSKVLEMPALLYETNKPNRSSGMSVSALRKSWVPPQCPITLWPSIVCSWKAKAMRGKPEGAGSCGLNDSLAVEGAAVEKRKHETTKVSAAGRQ